MHHALFVEAVINLAQFRGQRREDTDLLQGEEYQCYLIRTVCGAGNIVTISEKYNLSTPTSPTIGLHLSLSL